MPIFQRWPPTIGWCMSRVMAERSPGESNTPASPSRQQKSSSFSASTSESSSGERLDLSGQVCPFTFVHTKLRLEELSIGATLRVIVDHPPAAKNIPRSATEWGQRVLEVRAIDDTHWEITLEKCAN